MNKKLFCSLIFILTLTMNAQDKELPYHQIPDYPEDYSTGNVVGRMIDGLGFRYYWATEGLTPKDLEYKPSEDGRKVLEILQHIYSMSGMIKNAPTSTPNERSEDPSVYSYEELRAKTLENLKAASDLMKCKNASDFENIKVIFQRGEQQSEYPYWNMINGMLSDCIYHAGQITMLRRASGNPINPKVSVFNGRLRD